MCVCMSVCVYVQLAEEAGHVLDHMKHGGRLADFGARWRHQIHHKGRLRGQTRV